MKYALMLLVLIGLVGCERRERDETGSSDSGVEETRVYTKLGETPNCTIYKNKSHGWVTIVAENKKPDVTCSVTSY